MKKSIKPTMTRAHSSRPICPGCQQVITKTGECGGVDEGICSVTVLASDIDRGQGLLESIEEFKAMAGSRLPTLDLLARVLRAHQQA